MKKSLSLIAVALASVSAALASTTSSYVGAGQVGSALFTGTFSQTGSVKSGWFQFFQSGTSTVQLNVASASVPAASLSFSGKTLTYVGAATEFILVNGSWVTVTGTATITLNDNRAATQTTGPADSVSVSFVPAGTTLAAYKKTFGVTGSLTGGDILIQSTVAP